MKKSLCVNVPEGTQVNFTIPRRRHLFFQATTIQCRDRKITMSVGIRHVPEQLRVEVRLFILFDLQLVHSIYLAPRQGLALAPVIKYLLMEHASSHRQVRCQRKCT